MQNALDSLMADPWRALSLVIGDPLHPGGYDATEDLLDRADVSGETTLLDVGCGAGGALDRAHSRGARAIGLDRNPGHEGGVRGDLSHLPFADGSMDVVLAECVLCLASDLDAALADAHRVLAPDGRLALSDVVVSGPAPDLPTLVARALCLTNRESREAFVARIERAGFDVRAVHDHHDDLLAMRDRATEGRGPFDLDGFLDAIGEQGQRVRDGIDRMSQAVEDERIGYVSLVADVGA